MFVIVNSAGQIRCYPGSTTPYTFSTVAAAKEEMLNQGLAGASVAELDDSESVSESSSIDWSKYL